MTIQSHVSQIQFGLILITIASLPWYIIRFSIVGIPVTLPEAIAWASIAMWVVLKICSKTVAIPPKPWVVISVVWVLIAIISMLISPDLRAASGIFKAYFLLPVIFFYQLYDTIDTKDKLNGVLLAGLLAGLQIACVCLTQWVWGWPNIAPHELAQGRSSATFNTANAVGLALGPVIAFVGSYILYKKTSMAANIVLSVILLLLLVALLATKSEGAWLSVGGLLVGLAAIAACRPVWPQLNSQKTATIFATLVMLTYVAINIGYVAWGNHPPQVANPYTRPDFTTMTIRQCTWEGTWESLKGSPILGSGLAGFPVAYAQHYTCDAEPFTYPHNNVLTFWSETGLLGLLSFVAMTTLWIKQTTQGIISSKKHQYSWLYVAGLLSLVYWLIHGLVDVPYFKNDLAMLWWIIPAIVLVADKLRQVDGS